MTTSDVRKKLAAERRMHNVTIANLTAIEAELAAAQAEIANAADLKGALEATYAKLREVNETGTAVVSECVSEIAALKSRKVAYDKANPLGGPAKMFRAMAERIEAGEPWDEVLRDYDVAVGLRDKPCPHVRTSGTTSWCELARRDAEDAERQTPGWFDPNSHGRGGI